MKLYHLICIFQTGEVHQEFYRDTDLVIGAQVNVWGRKFLVCDLDEFTKEYYRTKYGLSRIYFHSISSISDD